jgi:cholesterol 25-hydroxylase
MRRPSKRLGETLIYAAPLLLMDFIMVKKFAQVPLDDILSSAGYAPRQMARDVRNAAGIMNNSTISNSFLLPTLHNFSKGSPLQLGRALPPVPPTSRRLVGELCASFFIYDAMFFLAHLAVHRIKPLMRIHESHHSHTEIHPQITNQLSMIERLSLVLFANFSLNIIGAHVLTRSIFIPIFVYLLVEIHSGIDLPWSYDKLMPAGWGAGAKTHAYHHRTGKGAFAPFFGWWDAGLKWATSSPVEKSPRARR